MPAKKITVKVEAIEKSEKVSLNIKVSRELDLRLKRARKAARLNKKKFNVSSHIEQYLDKVLNEIESQLSIKQDIKEYQNQAELFDEQLIQKTK